MIGDITAAAGAINRHFPRREDVRVIPTATDRENVRMFDKKKNVGESLDLLAPDELFLNCESGEIIQATKTFENQH